MTVGQIEKLGFPHMGSRIKPRLFYSTVIGEFKIPDYWNIDDIHRHIFERGVQEGIEKGKLEKINEIRESLGMDPKNNIW
jgi:hypothetical protein